MNIVDKKTYLSVSPPEDKPATPIREPAMWFEYVISLCVSGLRSAEFASPIYELTLVGLNGSVHSIGVHPVQFLVYNNLNYMIMNLFWRLYCGPKLELTVH